MGTRGKAVWWLRVAALATATVLGIASIATSVTARNAPAPRLKVKHASDALVSQTEGTLRDQGVRVSKEVHNMLVVVLRAWEDRKDIRTAFSEPDGRVNIPGLMSWATSLSDPASENFVEHLGAINELTARMGYLMGTTRIMPILFWSLKNESRLTDDFTSVLWHLSDIWNNRPEVQKQFTSESGRVNVLGFLKYVNGLTKTDPVFGIVIYDFFVIRQAIDELQRPNS